MSKMEFQSPIPSVMATVGSINTIGEDFSLSEEMEYVRFIEHNRRENETYVYYLQYTNNEDDLNELKEFIDSSSSDTMTGDCSVFEINLDVKLTEDMVDEQCKLTYRGKINGNFNNPLIYCEDNINKDEKRRLLDELFSTSILHYFKI